MKRCTFADIERVAAANGGKLVRNASGYWWAPGREPMFFHPTIKGLVARGLMRWSKVSTVRRGVHKAIEVALVRGKE